MTFCRAAPRSAAIGPKAGSTDRSASWSIRYRRALEEEGIALPSFDGWAGDLTVHSVYAQNPGFADTDGRHADGEWRRRDGLSRRVRREGRSCAREVGRGLYVRGHTYCVVSDILRNLCGP
jgi:hypothetical protein